MPTSTFTPRSVKVQPLCSQVNPCASCKANVDPVTTFINLLESANTSAIRTYDGEPPFLRLHTLRGDNTNGFKTLQADWKGDGVASYDIDASDVITSQLTEEDLNWLRRKAALFSEALEGPDMSAGKNNWLRAVTSVLASAYKSLAAVGHDKDGAAVEGSAVAHTGDTEKETGIEANWKIEQSPAGEGANEMNVQMRFDTDRQF